jgi:biotin carboxyl carrier protein
MPATVWKLLVSVGDLVRVGDELLVLESMKMEIPVESPSDGIVEAVHVAVGDSLQERQVLIELRRQG